ncbi:uncharacterized protein LOC8275314 [Ricinus communis]|uniref:uncharacterized protein LOC8275314 n=1 Tax=Ricinus communis TaxID=3988 RepID=UPI0007722B39|nr:uncharacterized protein LOC8275314 [Ricinus communis]|eukprot:XP_015574358.1 uncharacterized protein LOC8275314 [Ricinus communis]
MACLNMLNNEQQSLYTSSMDPRISFSSDFVDTQEAIKFETNYREAPVSSDFEFSVRNYSMIPADEIFCKGMILPSKDNCTNQLRKMTLRDKLLDDDDDFDSFPRVQKSTGWWKERLGLKRGHIVTKKGDRNHGVLERIVEEKRHVFLHEEGLAGKNTGSVD